VTLILGAYPIEPDDRDQRHQLFELLGACGLYGGLELPYSATSGARWPDGAPLDWRAVVTAIPGTMQRMSADPTFGLASTNAEGRARAIGFAAEICDYVAEMAVAGPQQLAVELHSAPRGLGSRDALAESLTLLAGWDWSGATLVIEHCDAPRPTWTPEKGFLELDDEIAAVAEATAATGTRLGITINWARSAIEGHGPEAPVRHVEAARAAGVLSGVMFSSCSPLATDFGYPWIDAHLPAREVEGAPGSTLLTAGAIRACVAAAGPVDYLGLKIGLRPASLGVEALVSRLATMATEITEAAVVGGAARGPA
jgi:hypothetical protein